MEFRPYQNQGRDFLIDRRKAILALPMGTGKTPVTVAAAESYKYPQELILAPSSAIGTWRRHLVSMTDNRLPVQIVWGQSYLRDSLWKEAKSGKPGFYISTYDTYWRDMKSGMAPKYWPLVIMDEFHRLRNRKTERYKWLHHIDSPHKYFLSGTPASRGPQDLWTVMSMIDPVRYRSYWRWVDEFCLVETTPFGRQITGVRNLPRFNQLMETYLYIRKKADILPELPPKTRSKIPIEMTPKQAKLYHSLRKDMIAELEGSGEVLITTTTLEKLLRLRQILVTPKLLDPEFPEYGGAIEAFMDRIEDLDEPHCVFFTPFAQALPILAERLQRAGHKYITLRGGLSPFEVERLENEFREQGGIALCSIQFAQSYSLSTSSQAYFAGYEYDPNVNEQAEDRLHRFDSVEACNMWYFSHSDTVDDQILDILNAKSNTVNTMFKYVSTQTLLRLLKGDSLI